jgi:hypothetical protein
MGQKTRSGAAAGNGMVGCRRGDDGVAGPAGELLADVPNHLEATRDVIEGLAYVLADAPQRAAAARAGRTGAIPHLLARQVVGQRPAGRLLCFGHALDDCRLGFQGLDRQLEVLALTRQLLRGGPKSVRR